MNMQSNIKKREYYKNQEYFDGEVKYNEESLKKFQSIVEDASTGIEHRTNLRYTIFRRNLEQLIARYSRGEPIASLQASYPTVIEALIAYNSESGHEAWDFTYFDAYIRALWLVSLAILLEADDLSFNRLLNELDNIGRDAIFEHLVALRMPGRPIPETLLFPKPYKLLYDALNATGDTRIALIGKFLQEYYKGMKKAYWHDTHLGEDTGFFGYWCFELAAFVKVLQIDDKSFAENMYYPDKQSPPGRTPCGERA